MDRMDRIRRIQRIFEGIRFEEGHALVPGAPGLGCELDLEAVERYRGR
jgi:L-alanine-DL-glutamate epimerase-like enolase superfamily enzyme